VNISQVISSGLQPAQNFLYTRINDPEHNNFNRIASSVALLLIVMTSIAAALAYGNARDEAASKEKKELRLALILLSAASIILMVRPSAFLWEYLPKLRFVQFPWRWLGILALPYSFFGAAVFRRRRAGWFWAVLVLLATTGTAAYLVHKAWWDSNDVPFAQEAISTGQGFEGTDEYDPAGDDHTDLPQNAPKVRILTAKSSEGVPPIGEIHIEKWNAETKVLHVTSREPVRIAIRLLNYPAWRLTVNGKKVGQKADNSAQIILSVPQGSNEFALDFSQTTDRTAGGLVSVVSLLGLTVLYWKQRN